MSEPCAGASVPSRRAPHQTGSRLRFAILTIPYLWLVAAIPFVGYRDNRMWVIHFTAGLTVKS